MRHQGRITNWNDERGFGFVLPDEGGERVFLHIKAFEQRHRRPEGDERVTCELRRDAKNRPQASVVRYAQAVLSLETLTAVLVAVGFLTLVGVMALKHRVPEWVPLAYLAASIHTYICYARDKASATQGKWRTSESTLHFLEMMAGWPGALAAQYVMRHKNRKQSFQMVFWGIVILHLALWIWVVSQNPFGAASTK